MKFMSKAFAQMSDKHNDMNTGFAEVKDFAEPNFEDTDSKSSVAQDVPKRQKSTREILIANNLLVLALYVPAMILSVASYFILGWYQGEEPPLWRSTFPSLMMLTYFACAGYLLKPMLRRNYLSLASLLLLASIPFVVIIFDLPDTTLEWIFFLIIVPVVTVGFLEVFGDLYSEILFATAAILTPSLCMYLGLRVKMWRQRRGGSCGE